MARCLPHRLPQLLKVFYSSAVPSVAWALTSKPAGAQDTQPSNQASVETQLSEHKKVTRSVTILHKETSARRLVGRLSVTPTDGSPYQSGTENISRTSLDFVGEQYREGKSRVAEENGAQQGKADQSADQLQNASNRQHHRLSTAAVAVTGLLGQLKAWGHAERQRQKTRRDKKAAKVAASSPGGEVDEEEFGGHISPVSSGDEAAQAAMDAFEALVVAAEISHSDEQSKRLSAHRRSSRRRPTRSRSLKGGHTSDTDYASDGEPVVPSCEEVLQTAEEVGMDEFKSQALKLAHTLRCKGWRGVALDRYKEISVERMSGALTNAVGPHFSYRSTSKFTRALAASEEWNKECLTGRGYIFKCSFDFW